MNASVSRLQLAAALLEYDNDLDDDEGRQSTSGYARARPKVSHRDSAMFLPFNPKPLDDWRPPVGVSERNIHHRQPSGQLDAVEGVSIPNVGSEGANEAYRMPRSSFSSARLQSQIEQQHPGHSSRSYPSHDAHGATQDGFGDEIHENQTRVGSIHGRSAPDVSSWNLPEHLVSPEDISPSPQLSFPRIPLASPLETSEVTHGQSPTIRNAEYLTPQPVTSPLQDRASSIHLDMVDGIHVSVNHETRHSDAKVEAVLRQSELIRQLAEESLKSPRLIPLPPSPATTLHSFPSRPKSSLSTRHTLSPASTKALLHPHIEEVLSESGEPSGTPNPFSLPAPPSELGSRFDPKVQASQGGHARSASNLSRESDSSHVPPWELPPSNTSRPQSNVVPPTDNLPHSALDLPPEVEEYNDDRPKSRVWDEIPTPQEYGRPLLPNRYSSMPRIANRASLLRPQTLIMPRSLSGLPEMSHSSRDIPEDFTLGDKPLPPGSRSSMLSLAGRRPLTIANLYAVTSRNSILSGLNQVVDQHGQKGSSDGLQAVESDTRSGLDERAGQEREGEDITQAEKRPIGKLYGTSLMDQLEARKAAMRSKQRVFTGDSRPAMMARPSQPQLRSGGSASPLSSPPESANQPGQDDTKDYRHTVHVTTDAGGVTPEMGNLGKREGLGRITKSQSVFGVDQIWEKELAKLRARENLSANDPGHPSHKADETRDKGKGRATDTPLSLDKGAGSIAEVEGPGISPIKRLPHKAPSISLPSTNTLPTSIPAHLTLGLGRQRATSGSIAGWLDDEDEQHGPPLERARRQPSRSEIQGQDSDSEEELPLSRLAKNVTGGKTKSPLEPRDTNAPTRMNESEADDDDEDVPLSKLPATKSLTAASSPVKKGDTIPNFPTGTDNSLFGSGSLGLDIPGVQVPLPVSTVTSPQDDPSIDDDDIPLGLRRPKSSSSDVKTTQDAVGKDDVEDDIPLGYKHASIMAQRQEESWRASTFSMGGISPFPSMQWGSHMPLPVLGYGMGMPSYPSYTQIVSPHIHPFIGQPSPSYGFPHVPGPGPQVPFGPNYDYGHSYGYGATGPQQGDYFSSGQVGNAGQLPDGTPPPQHHAAVKQIDSWRKGVATGPPGSSSGASGSGRPRSGLTITSSS